MTQKEQLTQMSEKIDKILRGIYGDPDNNVKGLLQRQEDDEERWRKMEPIMQELDVYPKIVSSFKFWNSKTTWSVITFISGGITWLVFNWDTKIKPLFK